MKVYVDVGEIPIRDLLMKYSSINKEEKEKDRLQVQLSCA